jgi:hypothetical protein
MWQPGAFNSWVGVPRYTSTTLVHVTPLVPPAAGSTETVVVGKGGAASAMQAWRFTVGAGSAGIGIPRGSIENLKGVNHQVLKSGFARVQLAPQFGATTRRTSAGYGEPFGSMASGTGVHNSAPASASTAHSSGGTTHR